MVSTTELARFSAGERYDKHKGLGLADFDQNTRVNLGGGLGFGEPINPDGLSGQVFIAVDELAQTNNNVYMMASVIPTGFSNGGDVMLVRGTDGGQTLARRCG